MKNMYGKSSDWLFRAAMTIVFLFLGVSYFFVDNYFKGMIGMIVAIIFFATDTSILSEIVDDLKHKTSQEDTAGS